MYLQALKSGKISIIKDISSQIHSEEQIFEVGWKTLKFVKICIIEVMLTKGT